MTQRTIVQRPPGAGYEIRVIGSKPTPLRDFYHALLRASWPAALSVITLGYLAINLLFALAFTVSGGVEHARAGSVLDAFFFSVQTMGTITRTERTQEGEMFYRSCDLALVRERALSLSRWFHIRHHVDEESPCAEQAVVACE